MTDQINRYVPSFRSSNMMPLKKTPFRIYVGFVVSDAFHGSKHKNPFDFRRHWLIKKDVDARKRPPLEVDYHDGSDDDSASISVLGGEDEYDDDEEDAEMEEEDEGEEDDPSMVMVPSEVQPAVPELNPVELKRMTKKGLIDKISEVTKLANLLATRNNGGSTSSRCPSPSSLSGVAPGGSVSSGSSSIKKARIEAAASAAAAAAAAATARPKGDRGKGPNRSKNPSAANAAATRGLAGERRVQRARRNLRAANPTIRHNVDPDLFDSTLDYCYIKNIELDLNGQLVSALNGPSSKHHCPRDFVRFAEAQHNYRTNQSDGLNYEMFNSNFYLAAFEFTNSVVPGDPNIMLPTVQEMNQIRVNVEFHGNLPQNTTMVVVCNCSSSIVMHEGQPLQFTYTNAVN
jgi:hypothetical protein